MAGPISGTVDILAELHARGTPLYLLSNFAAETYPLACRRFGFLRLFHGIIVSGEVRAIKPDPRIYEILIERYRIDPHRAVFIDDVAENVDAAQRLGIYGIQFIDPEALRAELAMLKLL
jgi:2-haloacid dehalogenase